MFDPMGNVVNRPAFCHADLPAPSGPGGGFTGKWHRPMASYVMRIQSFLLRSFAILLSFVCLFLLATDLTGCRNSIGRKDSAGEYEATRSTYGIERLALNRDGTYGQRLTFRSGRTVATKGTWDIDYDRRNSFPLAIVLHDALNMNTVLPVPQKHVGHLEARHAVIARFGRVRKLMIKEGYLYYAKRK